MKQFIFIIFLISAPLLFSNFGLVEYAVLHPKTKTIQTDSLTQKQVNLYAQAIQTDDVKPDKDKSKESANNFWASYIMMGMKAIAGFLIKILANF
ncbi:MAG: hypothetical protein AABZ56_06300 [Bacteroidota bacterium]